MDALPRIVSCEQFEEAAPEKVGTVDKATWQKNARIYEYTSAANPKLNPVPVLVHPASLHESGDTRVIPFDLQKQLGVDDCGATPRTSPNLLASYLRVLVGETLTTRAVATSQAFYVIRGKGVSRCAEHGPIEWSTGDLFVIPKTDGPVDHVCSASEGHGGAALYWVHDGPLLHYLGVAPICSRFDAALFTRERLLKEVEEISHASGAVHRNRLGVLLGNASTETTTLTLTHTLWSLLNSIGPHTVQRPHRHNSVALDLAVYAPWPPGKVYTLMGRELNAQGASFASFASTKPQAKSSTPFAVTGRPAASSSRRPAGAQCPAIGSDRAPIRRWHSHHNESDEVSWVLPMQDAGLYTFQRTLDIRFVE